MPIRALAWLVVPVAAVAGCVAHTHREGAALRMAWPNDRALAAGGATGKPTVAYPSVGGDILKGTSPAELAAARAATGEALTRALAKP